MEAWQDCPCELATEMGWLKINSNAIEQSSPQSMYTLLSKLGFSLLAYVVK